MPKEAKTDIEEQVVVANDKAVKEKELPNPFPGLRPFSTTKVTNSLVVKGRVMM